MGAHDRIPSDPANSMHEMPSGAPVPASRNTPLLADQWGQAPADHHLGDRRNPRTATIIRETVCRQSPPCRIGRRGRRYSKCKAVDVGDPRSRQNMPPRPWLNPSDQIGLNQISARRSSTPPCSSKTRWGAPPPRHRRINEGPQGLAETPRRPVLPLKIHHLPKISIRPHLAISVADFAAEGAATTTN
jgi:hypothetical protein